MPLPSVKERLTFEEYGAPEYWVDYYPIGSLIYSEFLKMNELSVDKSLTALEILKEKFKIWIINWNIPEFEDGEVLPLITKDENSFNKLPTVFIEHILTEITKQAVDKGGMTALPLVNGRETNLLPFTSPLPNQNESQGEEVSESSLKDSGQSD